MIPRSSVTVTIVPWALSWTPLGAPIIILGRLSATGQWLRNL